MIEFHRALPCADYLAPLGLEDLRGLGKGVSKGVSNGVGDGVVGEGFGFFGLRVCKKNVFCWLLGCVLLLLG